MPTYEEALREVYRVIGKKKAKIEPLLMPELDWKAVAREKSGLHKKKTVKKPKPSYKGKIEPLLPPKMEW